VIGDHPTTNIIATFIHQKHENRQEHHEMWMSLAVNSFDFRYPAVGLPLRLKTTHSTVEPRSQEKNGKNQKTSARIKRLQYH
jgi:hypothetical protein